MTAGPRLPEAESPRSRGLLIAVIILLIAVIALAVALIITLTGDDDADAPDVPVIGVTDPAPTAPGDGSSSDDSADDATPDTAPPAPQPPSAAAPTGPSEAELEESRQVLLGEQNRDPDDRYALGDVDADIVIVQYADYRCGYCAQWHVEVSDALEPYIESGQVRFEYRDHPVLGDASVYAALAARAAGNQGLFWEYGDALYKDAYSGVGPRYDGAYFIEVAERVGVEDIDAFTADLTDGDAYTEIMASRSRALALGITGTPTFIVHDTLVPGAIDEEQFLALVESRLA